jgi:hypothetical protein
LRPIHNFAFLIARTTDTNMPSIPKRVSERLISGIKRFQPILDAARSRDVNESDTSIIVTDILSEVFGYDKYSEITSELAIRGTSCDLAIKLNGAVEALVEVKAIGLEPKQAHIKQAIDYAANQGVDWVILTTGIHWHVYKVSFSKPIDQDLVSEFSFCTLNHKSESDLLMLYLLSKEGWAKSVLEEFHNQKQALSRFTIAAAVLSDPVVTVIRRELKKLSPDVKIDPEQIQQVLTQEVFKREVMEGEKADDARRRIHRLSAKTSKAVTEEPKVSSLLTTVPPVSISPEINLADPARATV